MKQKPPLEKASPVELRKSLEIANLLANSGIRFIPIPTVTDEEYKLFADILSRKLQAIEKLSEISD